MIDKQTTWVVPTLADLQTYLNNTQYQAISAGDLVTGQTAVSLFAEYMGTVTTRITSKLQGNANSVGSATDNAIPPECMWIACWLILEMLNTRIPSLNLTDDQKNIIKKAEKDLDNFASRKQLAALPTDPVNRVQQQGPATVVRRGSPQTVNAWTMRGI